MFVFFAHVSGAEVLQSRLKLEICIKQQALNARFRKQKNKVVGFLKVESLAFKATYFIVFAGSQSSRADALELYFPEKR